MKLPSSRILIDDLKTAFSEMALENIQGGKLKPFGQTFVRHAGATLAVSCFYGLLAAFAVKGVWSYFRHRTEKKQTLLVNQQMQNTFRQVSQMSQQLTEMQHTLNTLKPPRLAPSVQASVVAAPSTRLPVMPSYYAPSYAYPQYAMAKPYW